MSERKSLAPPKRPLRVALVGNIPTHYRLPLWEGLAEVFDIDFFFTSRGDEKYWSKDHRPEVGQIRILPARPRGAFVRTLMKGHYDCIFCGLVGRLSLLEAWFAAQASGTPVILWSGLWAHPQTAFHRFSRPVLRYMYRNADAIIVYGPHVGEHIAAESGRRSGVYEAPNAIDNAAFRRPIPVEEVASLRRRLQLPPGPAAVFVGRLERGKGLDDLLRAYARTKAPAALLIVGSGSLEDELKRLAERLAIQDRVFFTGYVANPDMVCYLEATDFLVLPSVTTRDFKEPWGLVANEAMNRGRPVVASTAVGAVAGGLIIDRVTGLVFREGDEEALAAAMDELAADAELRSALGAQAERHVLDWNVEKAVSVAYDTVLTVLGRAPDVESRQ